jgi:hypothetical protein
MMLQERLRYLESQGFVEDESNECLPTASNYLDADDDVSEEDDGAEYVFGAGRQTANMDEINRPENERQRESEKSNESPQNSKQVEQRGNQRPDQALIDAMLAKKLGIVNKSSIDEDVQPFDDLAELDGYVSDTSQASDTRSTSSTSSRGSRTTDYPQIHQVFKYEVSAEFLGIDIYSASDTYVCGTFHSLERANERVKEIVEPLAKQYNKQTDCELQEIMRNNLLELRVKIGADEAIQARAWVDMKMIEVDVSKMRSRKARRAILREERVVWAVDWVKTVTLPLMRSIEPSPPAPTTPSSNRDQDGSTTEEEDDLFGSSPSPSRSLPAAPPPQQSQTTTYQVTTITPSTTEILSSLYSTPFRANIAAMDLYLQWYAKFCPAAERPPWDKLKPSGGNPYNGALGQVWEGCDEERRRLGDWGLGLWEEEHFLPMETTDNGRDEGEVGGERKAEQRGRERFKVWVRKEGVLGPQN